MRTRSYLRRRVNRRPDQVSSIAQTLVSTMPAAKATSRITSPVRSDSVPAERFGQAIQRVPSPTALATAFEAARQLNPRDHEPDHLGPAAVAPANRGRVGKWRKRRLDPVRRIEQGDRRTFLDAELLSKLLARARARVGGRDDRV